MSDAVFPERVGHYRILRKIGQGGMGTVYEAEQDHPRRTVALKVITGQALSAEEALRRFELEVQVLGVLQHPGIAHIFEAGRFEIAGELRPFFAMELVRGVPLLEWAQTRELSTRDRLELLAKICDALHHAHERGVVHRDLKPGNILVTEQGEPKVLDFGVARATNADIQTVTMRTDVGQLVGTLPYMSPEQASGDPTRIDSRSDVYSLGVVGYQLLSGRMPYDIDRVMLHEGVRIVREVEAQRLSSVVRALRGDVETIIGRALEKEVDRRYESAAAMAEDIRRYLADEPIRARPPSSLYQLRKFARRNKVLVGGVVAVGLALVAGLIGTSLGIVEARRNARIAEEKSEEAKVSAIDARAREAEARTEAERANRTAAFLRDILEGVDPAFAQGVDTTLLERILADTGERLATDLADQPRIEVGLRSTLGSVYHAIGKYEPSLAHYERALALRRALGSATDASTLREAAHVAVVKSMLGRIEEARTELIGLREEALRALGDDHPVYDEIRGELGVVLMQREDHDTAAELFEQTLPWRREHLGQDHARTLITLNCLGLVRAYQNRAAEAEALLREVVERRERVDGPNHPDTIRAIANLGGFYSDRGRYAEAEELVRRTYAANVAVMGGEHPATLHYLASLAMILRKLGRADEARELYERALEALRRVSGPDHPETLHVESGLGVLFRGAGDIAAAERLHRHVLDVKRREHGELDPETLEAELDVASDLMAAGRTEEAEAMRVRLAEVMPAVLGERNDSTLILLNDLGVHYLRTGRVEAAERLFRRTLALRLDVLGPDHPETLVSAGSLGLALQDLGRHAEAIPPLARMLDGWSRLHGDDDGATRNTAKELLESAELVDDLGPLERELASLVAYHRRLASPSRETFARSLVVLAESRAALGRWDECAPLLDEAVELLTRSGFDGGSSVARAFGTLGAIKLARGKLDEAEPLLVQCWEGAGERDLVAKRKAASELARVHEARGDTAAASVWRERAVR